MDAIAARAGVGKNTIYRRWPSKEELVADAIRDLTSELHVDDAGDLRSFLLAQIREVRDVLSDPLVGRLLPGLLGELRRNPELAAAWAERVVQPRRRAIVERLEQALERGELREGADPSLVADLLFGPVLLRLLVPVDGPRLEARDPDALLETIWTGIAPTAR